MTLTDVSRHEPTIPTELEVKQAVVALEQLQPILRVLDASSIEPVAFPEGLEIPAPALQLLADLLSELANGNAVRIVPVHAELTTQQAADLINVSRPFLIRLLEDGQLPFRRVGNRRRLLAEDVLAYKRRDDARRREVLDELTREGQSLNVDY